MRSIIGIILVVIGWAAVGTIAWQIYKKQEIKPKIWKVIIIIFIGLFSFSIDWPLFDQVIRISILPLGVWILFLLRGRLPQWPFYRKYAWLGFFANFIFLAAGLLAIVCNQAVYPQNQLLTYLANVEQGFIINTHPAAENLSFDKENAPKLLLKGKEKLVRSTDWYELSETSERFPYQLIGAKPKFGSNLSAIIYVEQDGKGLLIQTPNRHYYFRLDESLLKEGS
ncbi:hypothetical protein [Bacillus sp. FJAT-29814]|uniref:hypothetical protein n=1 Tax=Bacillus sp. FJAT-29814 TaxID=1729688 RepID=UPI00082FABB0|nr:hypothetical protein [Bacillus sp. FJAT-29814]